MPTFDGPNLLITLDPLPSPNDGAQNINVQDDLYEQWKLWVQMTPDNLKYPEAFRTIGGDPLTPGVEAGAYFFLNNVEGWRIISSNETQTINYSGNLVGEDSTLEMVLPTPGFTVLHLGLQPVTQRVDEILSGVQSSLYGAAVSIDTSGFGSPGTEFPIGTPAEPVDNLADALTIAAREDIREFHIAGHITLDALGTYPAHARWIGESTNASLDFNSTNVEGMLFRRLDLFGAIADPGSPGELTILEECRLAAPITGFCGIVSSCVLGSSITLRSGMSQFIVCASVVAGTGSPVINANGQTGIDLTFRNYNGGLRISNFTAGDTVSTLAFNVGRLNIDATCTDFGDCEVRGIVEINNESALLVGPEVSPPTQFNTDGTVQGSHTALLPDIHGQVRRSIYIDPAAATNGDGYQQSPYNNITSAIDNAEFRGITSLVLLGDLTLDRQLKNFTVSGIGAPALDVNGQNIDGCFFEHIELTGNIGGGSIRCSNTILRHALTGINGTFFTCGFDGDLTLAASGTIDMVDCFSSIGGLARPTISVNGARNVAIRGYRGGLTVQNVTAVSPQSEVSVSMAQGKLTLAASCVGGVISVRGLAQFTNLSLGSVVDTTGLLNTEEQQIAQAFIAGRVEFRRESPDLGIVLIDAYDTDGSILRTLRLDETTGSEARTIV
jgi:hypothetical protein